MFYLQAAAFRTRILRSVDFAVALEEATSRDTSNAGGDYIPEIYAYLHTIQGEVINEI